MSGEWDPTDLAEMWAAIDRNITERGWHGTGVFPTEDATGPPFNYTVGLAEQGYPELIVFGLPLDTGHALLDILVERMRGERERLSPGPVDHVAAGYRCWLIDADPEEARDFARFAFLRAEGRSEGIRVMQLVWPDPEGHLPWEESYSIPPGYPEQPVIGEAP